MDQKRYDSYDNNNELSLNSIFPSISGHTCRRCLYNRGKRGLYFFEYARTIIYLIDYASWTEKAVKNTVRTLWCMFHQL